MSKAPNRASVTGTPSAQRWAPPVMSRRMKAISPFVYWEPDSPVRGLPYEWYRLRKTRLCSPAGTRADSILVVWLPDEALTSGVLGTLTSLSQGLVCQETAKQRVSAYRNQAFSRAIGSGLAAGGVFQDRRAPQFVRLPRRFSTRPGAFMDLRIRTSGSGPTPTARSNSTRPGPAR